MKHTLFPLLLALGMPLGAASSAPQCKPVPAAVYDVPVVLLVDLSAGQTLYAHEAERRLLPASITKAMSALVAFDLIAAGKLSEDAAITVRPDTAARWSGRGTTLALRSGEQVKVRDLLMGLTTVSANDAAVALAEGALGSNEAWIAAMNARAQRLGMSGSHFATANGFPDGGKTYVTARDLVRLAQALITDHPALYQRYIGRKSMVWRGTELFSHDPFAGGALAGADGIKTGHTYEAGFNFLGAVERDGRRLVLVIGGAQNEDLRGKAATGLAEWGYSAWDSRAFLGAGQRIGSARVQNGDTRRVPLAVPRRFTLAVPKGFDAKVGARVVYRGPLRAPIAKGAQVAGLEVTIEGQPVHYLPLVAAETVDRAGPIDRIVNGLLGLVS
ncbi:MAG TPA: D-alanyl-D-alanine carboxypeptidase family protein [Novosphingobium sp.]|nr:D-alanyl-D-alanine carboxypeptidase family protein [Novosphingobium sp.]